MKKLLGLLCALACTSWAQADTMNFVTVLSSPVGTFNKLEAVDPAAPAKSPVINFCTGVGSGGTVTLKGSSRPEMNTVNIASDAVLGRSGGTYVLRTITMGTGGKLKGSRLLANTLNVNYSTAGKSTNLYTKSLTVAGAKTQTLDVNNGDSKITAQHGAADMVWSNQYQSDKACGSTAECAKQYLLKSKSTASASGDDKDTKMCIVKLEWRTEDLTILGDGCNLKEKIWEQALSEPSKSCALEEDCDCADNEWVRVTGYSFNCNTILLRGDSCSGKTVKTGAYWGKCRSTPSGGICLPTSTILFQPNQINNMSATGGNGCHDPIPVGMTGELVDKNEPVSPGVLTQVTP